jgi:hypothetical protein
MTHNCWECGKQLPRNVEIVEAVFYSVKTGLHSTVGFCSEECMRKCRERTGITLVSWMWTNNKQSGEG